MPDNDRAIAELRELVDRLTARLQAAENQLTEIDDRVADLEDHVDELDEAVLGPQAPSELDAVCDECGWSQMGFATPAEASAALEAHKAARHPA